MQSTMISKKQWFLLGVTAGVILSLAVTPLVDDCHRVSAAEDETNWYSLIANSDFNPVVRLNHNKSQVRIDQNHINKRVFRPKYYSQELDIKDNLLICVCLSSSASNVSYLLNATVDQMADKVMFFHDRYGQKPTGVPPMWDSIEVPFVRSTPKYLNLLNYLFESKIVENFSFIFIVSDKTFINQNILYDFLNNLSVSQHILALPLISHKNFDNLDSDSNPNDILDSGVIVSTSLLMKCHTNQNCLNHFHNNHPNRENKQFLSYQLTYFSQIADQNKPDIEAIESSLTIFPVTDANTYTKLNIILCQKSINQSIERLQVIEDQIITSNDNESVLEWPLGVEPPVRANNRFEVIRWTYCNESHVFMPNDFDVVLPVTDIEDIELSHVKFKCVEWLRRKYRDLISEDIEIVNFYKKFDASRGLEYVIDLRSSAFSDIKRLQVIKRFNKIELIPNVPYVTESVRIIMILTIRSGEEVEFSSSFLTQYSNTCLKKSNHKTILILVFIYKSNSKTDPFIRIKSEATQLQTKYKNFGAKIAWIQITSAKEDRVPTEVAYFDLIAKRLSQSFSDALLLHCRPNMMLSLDYLNRVRLNTIQSNQVFFPIPFVEYRFRSQVKPSKNFDVRKDSGYFESTNYNYFSFYLSDYLKARKVIQRMLPIVRNEYFLRRHIYYGSDVDFHQLFAEYNKFWFKTNRNNKLFIMRSIEPELRVKALTSGSDCPSFESNRFAIENCLKRNVFGLGTRPQLAALVMDHQRKDRTREDTNDSDLQVN